VLHARADQPLTSPYLPLQVQYYKLELTNREDNYNQLFGKRPTVGVIDPLAGRKKSSGNVLLQAAPPFCGGGGGGGGGGATGLLVGPTAATAAHQGEMGTGSRGASRPPSSWPTPYLPLHPLTPPYNPLDRHRSLSDRGGDHAYIPLHPLTPPYNALDRHRSLSDRGGDDAVGPYIPFQSRYTPLQPPYAPGDDDEPRLPRGRGSITLTPYTPLQPLIYPR